MQDIGWLSTDPLQKLQVLETHLREQAERADNNAASSAQDDRDGASVSIVHTHRPGCISSK